MKLKKIILAKITHGLRQLFKMSENQANAKSIEKFLTELDVRIRARYPLISINTYEEDRVRDALVDLVFTKNGTRKSLPIKAVRELKSIISEELRTNQNAEIKIKKANHLEFEIGNKTMTAREFSGNFPNWEMVIPKNFESFAEINARQFAEALNRVGVLADDTHRRVELIFHPDKVQLKAESPETGYSSEEVNCTFRLIDQPANGQSDNTEGWKVAFNTKYLMDFFSIHGAKREEQRIIWKFAGGHAQTELMFEGEERLFSYILVPLKV